jgi:gliding motility-associated-like protein
MKKIGQLLLYLFVSFLGNAQEETWIHPNKGQWDSSISSKVELNQGELLVGKKGFAYFLHDAKSKHQHTILEEDHLEDSLFKTQTILKQFINANWANEINYENPSNWYKNYFLGKDTTKWKSAIHSYSTANYKSIYPGIDAVLTGKNKQLQYTFLLQPNADPSLLVAEFSGANSIVISDEGNLVITHRFGTITESKPLAWTEKNGVKQEVEIEFQLINNLLSFVFPNDYDHSATLTIDPFLVFSSFTGATADNWGMTATPDANGNLYAGGIVFTGVGSYPTTAGAFDLTINGGYNYNYVFNGATFSMTGFDVAISKFNTNGTSLIYSTYLGGAGNEAPHSLVVDSLNNLYVFGVTGSNNFPTNNGCYDNTFNGGPVIAENELGYNGTDLFISRFNAAGSALVASTYIGGTGTDGVNIGALNYNYGDPFRGEIITKDNFVYVTTSTQSSDFPTVGASQVALNGGQDAVILKMNTGLSNLIWSTYYGGSQLESGNSIQLAINGDVFVTGGTNSSNLPVIAGNDLTYNGGVSDGFLVKLNGATSTQLAGTYIGQGEYDQSYFVQLDLDDNVYVYGQTETAWAISPGKYGNANSGQFIRKYSNNLQTVLWTTMIGAGSGHPEISPTAFLVSNCYEIYISGWGGFINTSYSNQAEFSTTNNFPITPDGYQLTTNGSNFYIAVLGPNATTLKYGTYFGGATSSFNHVDGGTSRFDKTGRIYHAVCAACGGNDFGFTTTPSAWSPQNPSTNCNLAAFKFELNVIDAIVNNPAPLICIPAPVIFSNNSTNGNSFFWDFGDGSTSNQLNPSHNYTVAGNYSITLIVSDSNECFTADTTTFDISIGSFQGGVVQPNGAICPGETFQLEAYGGAIYQWSPPNLVSDAFISNPTTNINQTTTFTVIISDSCGADTLQTTVLVFNDTYSVSNDTSLCIGNSAQLIATGGGSYNWTPANTLSNGTISNPIATPTNSTTYNVTITSPNGCVYSDSVNVNVFFDLPIPMLIDTLKICKNTSGTLIASGADTYFWYPNTSINLTTGATVNVNPPNDFTYYCDFTNACGTLTDSVYIDVISPTIVAGNDTTICLGDFANLWASGAVTYQWMPAASINFPTASAVVARPTQTTTYNVIGTDSIGCIDTAYVTVSLFPTAFVQTNPDVYAIPGDEIQLNAISTTPGNYTWSPSSYLSCVNCQNPFTSTEQEITYTVEYTDQNGCRAKDNVTIYFEPLVYIPNTFTPNDDENNQTFSVTAYNIQWFELIIYNRWGEELYQMTSTSDFWDGTYKGYKCQDGTYIWKLTYKDLKNYITEQNGHINLIR